MATISVTSVPGRFKALLAGQTTTTTSWVQPPPWASIAIVHLVITVAGTSTILTLKAAQSGAGNLDDAAAATITFYTGATITAASFHTYTLHPLATAVADAAGASTMAVVPALVPTTLGITVTPNGSTYYTAIEYRSLT